MNNEKSFIILTPGFPACEADTTCLPMQQFFVRTIRQLYPGIKIIILSFQYPYHQNPYRWNDIQVIPFGGRNRGGITKALLRRKIDSTLKQIAAQTQLIGLLSFWSNECAWVGKRFGDNYGVKHCCWILGQDAKKENKYPRQLQFRPAELIALSDFIQDEFERNHAIRPQFVIPPAVDAGLFNAPPKKRDIDLLGVGSLIPLKRYELFIDAVAAIKKNIPQLKAVLVGTGPDAQKLQSFALELGLANNLRFAGELPHIGVIRMMQAAKILLHPSSYEGFGCVCLEALQAGSRVISFCKPMNTKIENWKVVRTKQEMIAETLRTLCDPEINYQPLSIYAMQDSVKRIMDLFKP